jgi:hypothetical protein
MVAENLKHFNTITGKIPLKLLVLDWNQRLNALSFRPNAVQFPHPREDGNSSKVRNVVVFFEYETKSTSQMIPSVTEHRQEPLYLPC